MTVTRHTEIVKRTTFYVSNGDLRHLMTEHIRKMTGEELGRLISLSLEEGGGIIENSITVIFESLTDTKGDH